MKTTILGVEFRVIIPAPINDTQDTLLEQFQRDLIAKFGGYTVQDGTGAWAEDNSKEEERVWIYTVAAPWYKQATLEKLALDYAKAAGETAIYVSKTDSVAALLWPS